MRSSRRDLAFLQQLEHVLIAPVVPLPDPYMQRKSTALAIIILATTFIIWLGAAFMSLRLWGTLIPTLPIILISALLNLFPYYFARRGEIRRAALVLNINASALILLIANWIGGAEGLLLLHYDVLVTCFAAYFLSVRTAFYHLPIRLLLMLIFGTLMFQVPFEQVILGPMTFNLVVSSFAILFAYLWQQDVKARVADLARSEQRYRTVSGLASDITFYQSIAADGSMHLEWLTGAFERITGYPLTEALEDASAYFHPEDLDRLRADRARVLQGELVNGDYRLLRKDGDVRWVTMDLLPARDHVQGRTKGFYGVVVDITSRKQTELALRASEQRYRIVSELTSDYTFYVQVNTDGTRQMEWVTDACEVMTGYSREELQAPGFDSARLYHPEDVPFVRSHRDRVLAGRQMATYCRLMRKDGTIRYIQLRRKPVWDETNKRVIGYYGGVMDMSDRKQAEQREWQLALWRQQFSIVSHFVHAISHDFRNRLSTIESSRHLISRLVEGEAREKIAPRLDTIHQMMSQMMEQIDNLSAVTALSDPRLEMANINHLLDVVLARCSTRAMQRKITLCLEKSDHVPMIYMDSVQMERALNHLMMNAIHYTPNGGLVTLRTDYVSSTIVIEVEDNGTGIPEEQRMEIFEPFFKGNAARTVSEGGVGVGLTIVKMVVEAHHGTIEVESEVGEGSLFRIFLPQRQPEPKLPTRTA